MGPSQKYSREVKEGSLAWGYAQWSNTKNLQARDSGWETAENSRKDNLNSKNRLLLSMTLSLTLH